MDRTLQGLNIYLIGMMGTGKTTVGDCLAELLRYRFFDADVIIENVVGKTINQIFAEEGEALFREIESQVLSQLAAQTRSVIATGGGMILKPENWYYLRQGLIIWLDVPVPILVDRLSHDTTRPLLQTEDLAAKLTSLLEQRSPLYQEADLTMTIGKNDSPKAIAARIIDLIPSKIKDKLPIPNPENN